MESGITNFWTWPNHYRILTKWILNQPQMALSFLASKNTFWISGFLKEGSTPGFLYALSLKKRTPISVNLTVLFLVSVWTNWSLVRNKKKWNGSGYWPCKISRVSIQLLFFHFYIPSLVRELLVVNMLEFFKIFNIHLSPIICQIHYYYMSISCFGYLIISFHYDGNR